MTIGPLRGLAARALGVAAPLRVQCPVAAERTVEGPADNETTTHLATHGPSLATPWPRPATDLSIEPNALPLPASRKAPDRLQPSVAAPRSVMTGQVKANRRAASMGLERDDPRGVGSDMSPAPSAVTQRMPPAPAQVASHPTAAQLPVSSTLPAPLLPLRAPTPLPQAPLMGFAARRQQTTAQRGTAAPIEVHVSIGRVELTALAPATTARAPSRRDAADGRSLADYLRGTSTGQERPA